MALAEFPREERLGRLLQDRKFRDALPLAQDPDYDVNFVNDDVAAPLYYVATEGSADAVAVADALLARDDIDVNITWHDNGITPLIAAIDEPYWPFVRKLLARDDIDVNHVFVIEGHGGTALDWAEQQLAMLERYDERGQSPMTVGAREVIDELDAMGAMRADELDEFDAEAAAAEGRRREAQLDAAQALVRAAEERNTSEADIGRVPASPAELSEEVPEDKEEEEARIGQVPKGGRKTRRKPRKTAKKKTRKTAKKKSRKGGRRTRRIR
jgi:hypothetical protein